MANAEMYDYLEDGTPDVGETLSVDPQGIVFETGQKKIVIHEGDDVSEERIILSDKSIFYAELQFKALSQSNAGTIFDLYHNTSRGCGEGKSFWWTPPADYDGHTYVVRFVGSLKRFYQAILIYGFGILTLKILNRKPDA